MIHSLESQERASSRMIELSPQVRYLLATPPQFFLGDPIPSYRRPNIDSGFVAPNGLEALYQPFFDEVRNSYSIVQRVTGNTTLPTILLSYLNEYPEGEFREFHLYSPSTECSIPLL